MLKPTTSAKLAGLSAILLLAACADKKEMAAAPPSPAPVSAPAPAPMQAPPQQMAAPAPIQRGILPGSAEDFRVNVGDRVLFDYDKSDLTENDRGTLQKQAAWLQRFPTVTLIVEGHCDERGTREYNLALGDRKSTRLNSSHT